MVSSIVIPAILDFYFIDSSFARYSRILILLLILSSAIIDYKLFLNAEAVGVGTILMAVGLYLVGTMSALSRGGVITPNFATLLVLLLLASLNFDLYKHFLNAIGLSILILMSISVFVILIQLNPRNFYLSSAGYPVIADFIGIPGRNYGVFSHPNSLGQASALCLIYLLNTKRNGFWVLVPIFCILKCGSRTSMAIMVVVTIYFIFSKLNNKKGVISRSRENYPLITAALLILIFSAFTAILINYIGILSPDSLTGRVSIWQAALEIFQGNTLAGLGWGWEDRAIDSQLLNVWAVSAHNALLEIIISTGLLGLFAFLAIVSKPLAHLTNLMKLERIFLVSILISGVSESFIDLQYPNITTFIVLLISMTSHRRREIGDERNLLRSSL